jgi:hypothetical protein
MNLLKQTTITCLTLLIIAIIGLVLSLSGSTFAYRVAQGASIVVGSAALLYLLAIRAIYAVGMHKEKKYK